MLNFRRKPAPAPRVEPKAAKSTPTPSAAAITNADKARALIAMLENGGDGAAIPPERLRDWARDLVETVERRPDGSPTPQATAPETLSPDRPVRPARLFSTAAPVLFAPALTLDPKRDPPRVAASDPVAQATFSARPPAAAVMAAAASAYRPHGGGRLNLSAPMPHVVEPAGRDSVRTPSPSHAMADIRKLIDGTVDPRTLACEHPAIIAMTLARKPSLEQAAALRRLPKGQIRAVRRALRQIQVAPA